MTARTDAARTTERRTVEICGEMLTPMEAQFVRALPLHHLNARAAARAAGYADDKSGRKLMGRPAVRRAAARQSGELLDRAGITGQAVLDELAAIGMADLGDVMEWGPNGEGRLKPSINLSPVIRRTVQSVKTDRTVTTRTYTDDGGHEVTEETVHEKYELKLYDRLAALKLLAEYHGILKETDMGQNSAPTLVQLAIAIYGTPNPVFTPAMIAEADQPLPGEDGYVEAVPA